MRALDTPVTAPAPAGAPRHAGLARQTVHFCRTLDGVRLAYALSGAGPPLVKASNWLTHLDYDWGSPVWSHWWQALSEDRRLVRYDERGCGLSDWDVDEDSFTLEAWVADLETVVDTLGLERFPLLGMSQGGPIAITYAARHPERVSHLVVYGTCARATWARATQAERRELAALGELIRMSWGSDQPGFRQVYDARFLPDGPLEIWRAFDELQRRTTSPENAYRLWRAFGSLDAADAARSLDVPTLILHCRDDLVWSFAEAEELHSLVEGSRLVPLDKPQPHPAGRRAGVRRLSRRGPALPRQLTARETPRPGRPMALPELVSLRGPIAHTPVARGSSGSERRCAEPGASSAKSPPASTRACAPRIPPLWDGALRRNDRGDRGSASARGPRGRTARVAFAIALIRETALARLRGHNIRQDPCQLELSRTRVDGAGRRWRDDLIGTGRSAKGRRVTAPRGRP